MAKFKDNFRVRISDADVNGFLKIPALMGMFQEIASDHAESLNIGAGFLTPQGWGWALSKMLIKVERLPRWGERLYISTWPSTRNKIYTEREFVVESESGDVLISARSLWILFNLEKRKFERLDKLPQWPRLDEFANEEKFEDMPPSPQGDELCISNFGVRKDDLDINGHVNNAIYLTWALEPLCDKFYNTHKVKRVEIWFLNEVFRGDRLESVCQTLENESRHSVVSDAKDRIRAKIDWICA